MEISFPVFSWNQFYHGLENHQIKLNSCVLYYHICSKFHGATFGSVQKMKISKDVQPEVKRNFDFKKPFYKI